MRSSRCFCSALPSSLAQQSSVVLLPAAEGEDRSTAFLLLSSSSSSSSSLYSSSLGPHHLLSSRASTVDSIPSEAPWSPAPVFTMRARAALSLQIFLSFFLSMYLSHPFSLLLYPSLSFMSLSGSFLSLGSSSPIPLIPAASSYTSPGSRLLLVSFSPGCADLFANAEASLRAA